MQKKEDKRNKQMKELKQSLIEDTKAKMERIYARRNQAKEVVVKVVVTKEKESIL